MEWTDSLTGLGWALSSSKAKWEGFLGLDTKQDWRDLTWKC